MPNLAFGYVLYSHLRRNDERAEKKRKCVALKIKTALRHQRHFVRHQEVV